MPETEIAGITSQNITPCMRGACMANPGQPNNNVYSVCPAMPVCLFLFDPNL